MTGGVASLGPWFSARWVFYIRTPIFASFAPQFSLKVQMLFRSISKYLSTVKSLTLPKDLAVSSGQAGIDSNCTGHFFVGILLGPEP